MATTPRKGKPFVWVSWLTGVLAGQEQCQWKGWFRSHFKYEKRVDGFDLAAWTADHDAMVRRRAEEFEATGHKVRQENENWCRVTGDSAILTLKPDIIASQGGMFTIADGKTGEASKKDWWQLLVYLMGIPLAWDTPNLRLVGELFYKTGDRVSVYQEELTKERRKEIAQLIRLFADPIAPKRVPSIPECGRCDIAECPDRMEEKPLAQVTTEF